MGKLVGCLQQNDHFADNAPAGVPDEGPVLVERFVQGRPGDGYDEVEEPVDCRYDSHSWQCQL